MEEDIIKIFEILVNVYSNHSIGFQTEKLMDDAIKLYKKIIEFTDDF